MNAFTRESHRQGDRMETKILKINKENPEPEILHMAAQIIKKGGLVAFPTETVYGLGGNALDPDASARIYTAKGRPSDNPLIVHIADFAALSEIAQNIPEKGRILADKFWPGPLTMIFEKTKRVPYSTTGGLETVAVRMPGHAVALAFIREAGGFIAAPSANTSGRPSPTLAEHTAEDLNGIIDMILDGGSVGIGLESTIVDLTVEPPMLLRPGYITIEMLEEVIGPVVMDPTLFVQGEALGKPKAPGMKYRHYAPKAELSIVEGDPERVIERINEIAKDYMDNGQKVGVIASSETMAAYHATVVKAIGSREDEEMIARQLYGILREFDQLEVDAIYSEAFETPRMGQAIMNRLLKAAGYRVIYVPGRPWKKSYQKIIFLCNGGTCRSPMAKVILEAMSPKAPLKIEAKGFVSLFPEPLNQKTEAILAANGLKLEGYQSEELSSEDITENTLILTMEEAIRKKVCEKFPEAGEVYNYSDFVGLKGDIYNPYGDSLADYGACFTQLKETTEKLIEKINQEVEKV